MKQTITLKSKITKKDVEYPINSNRARKEEAKKRERVVYTGSTLIKRKEQK
jgi:hypothetical protein